MKNPSLQSRGGFSQYSDPTACANDVTRLLKLGLVAFGFVLVFMTLTYVKSQNSQVDFVFKNLVDDLKVNTRVPSLNPSGTRTCIRERLHIVCTTDRESVGLEFCPFSLNATVYIYYRSAKFTLAPSARRLPNTHLHHLHEQDTDQDSTWFLPSHPQILRLPS